MVAIAESRRRQRSAARSGGGGSGGGCVLTDPQLLVAPLLACPLHLLAEDTDYRFLQSRYEDVIVPGNDIARRRTALASGRQCSHGRTGTTRARTSSSSHASRGRKRKQLRTGTTDAIPSPGTAVVNVGHHLNHATPRH